MKITFGPKKNQKNIEERGLSFELAVEFDFKTALVWEDKRNEYGETRFSSLGKIEGRIYALTFKETEDGFRVISFRKANKREVKKYEGTKKT